MQPLPPLLRSAAHALPLAVLAASFAAQAAAAAVPHRALPVTATAANRSRTTWRPRSRTPS
ncbi:hypothetical protein [Streptomyces sp. NPDC088131]|uniref:hypothetical protein n=1 Tax=Streptomyces sp. NPDC088131 TaxID=3365826 RepID=UPI0038179A91